MIMVKIRVMVKDSFAVRIRSLMRLWVRIRTKLWLDLRLG